MRVVTRKSVCWTRTRGQPSDSKTIGNKLSPTASGISFDDAFATGAFDVSAGTLAGPFERLVSLGSGIDHGMCDSAARASLAGWLDERLPLVGKILWSTWL
ncbi:MAG: hypothetical protein GXY83_37745 [Rhodopirellula sp.]|nr:hypothetical protein [Rhodopirellula sp.]